MKWAAIAACLSLVSSAAAQYTARPAESITDAPLYTVIDLGHLTPGPGMRTKPRAIQDPVLSSTVATAPMVVGMSTDAAGLSRPFLWTANWGVIEGIAGLPGRGEALAVNRFGDYVGVFAPAVGAVTGPQHAFLASVRMGAVHYMPTLGGANAAAYGINDAMVIAGWSQNFAGQRRATVWADMGGVVRDLGTFGGDHSEAFAINSLGQVVGRSQRPDGAYRAFLHDPTSPLPVLMTDLGSLSRIGGASARDISNTGFIVGSSDVTGPTLTSVNRIHRRAAMWQRGSTIVTNLGALNPLDPASEALAVNNMGAAVGWSGRDPAPVAAPGSRTPQRAFLWDGERMHDLNSLIPPTSGWILLVAEDINDAGLIIGWGVRVAATTVSGEVRGFLLVPRRQ